MYRVPTDPVWHDTIGVTSVSNTQPCLTIGAHPPGIILETGAPPGGYDVTSFRYQINLTSYGTYKSARQFLASAGNARAAGPAHLGGVYLAEESTECRRYFDEGSSSHLTT